MDGAIRFTQRDALAAILITGVNIVAGLIIGVFQHGLDLATAAETYTHPDGRRGPRHRDSRAARLDGGRPDHHARRVGIAPRRGSGDAAARARRSRSAVAAGVLALLALIPGLPKFAFLSVAARARRWPPTRSRRRPEAPVEEPPAPAADRRAGGGRPRVDPLSVEVGYALVSLVDEKQGGTLLTRVRAIRRQIATETGVVVAPVHVADNLQLGPRALQHPRQGRRSGARRAVRRSPAGHQPGHGDAGRSTASQTKEPAFGLPGHLDVRRSARGRRRGRLHRRRCRRRRSRRTCRRRSARSCPTC